MKNHPNIFMGYRVRRRFYFEQHLLIGMDAFIAFPMLGYPFQNVDTRRCISGSLSRTRLMTLIPSFRLEIGLNKIRNNCGFSNVKDFLF